MSDEDNMHPHLSERSPWQMLFLHMDVVGLYLLRVLSLRSLLEKRQVAIWNVLQNSAGKNRDSLQNQAAPIRLVVAYNDDIIKVRVDI